MKTSLFLGIFFTLLLAGLMAQAEEESDTDLLEAQSALETMKSQALDAVSREDFQEALDILDRAIALAPEDQLLKDMRLSVRELQVISVDGEIAASVDTRQPEFYEQPLPAEGDGEEPDVEAPDFAEELIAGRQSGSPVESREAVIAAFGGHWGRSKPVYLENDSFYQHKVAEDLSSAVGVFGDFQYFFEDVDRALGFNARYYGNLFNLEDGDRLLHQVDMGVMLRGFFQETLEARSVLGFRFAASLLYLNEYVRSEAEPSLANALTFGIFYSDPFLRHIFRESDFFRRLVLDLGVDYYYLTLSESSYMIRYNGVLSYRITPEFRFGAAGRIISTAQDIQVLSAWDIGWQLTFSQ